MSRAVYQSIDELNRLRHRAVRLRLDGHTLEQTRHATGLSVPTIIAATRCYREGGWTAVNVRPRGRRSGGGTGPQPIAIDPGARVRLIEALTQAPADTLWDRAALHRWLQQQYTSDISPWQCKRWLEKEQLLPSNPYRSWRDSEQADEQHWFKQELKNFSREARRSGAALYWVQQQSLPGDPEVAQLAAFSLRGRTHLQLRDAGCTVAEQVAFLAALEALEKRPLALITASEDALARAALQSWHNNHASGEARWLRAPRRRNTDHTSTLNSAVQPEHHTTAMPQQQYIHTEPARFTEENSMTHARESAPDPAAQTTAASGAVLDNDTLTHLERLEAESIHIMREVVAEADNPVMLYSIGKDSAVMLHLAVKAFYPAPPPFPLLHVDTTWKFKAMYELRDRMSKEHNFELLVYTNEDGVRQGINPFSHGSEIHTDVMKTQALKQALDKYGFDVAFGGARRDEEKSRAKERIFSFRSANHRWEPKNQRPELWKLYNARKQKGESIRVFPISNWTELDIWQYIYQQNIPIVPLYYSDTRPVVERDGTLIMVDDERMPLREGETPMMKSVRFRTLGCYPLTGAVESTAATLPEIIQEMLLTRTSERSGRLIDHDQAASMEKKKQEGYF